MSMFLAGVALGLAASAHCAVMCGPLVLTIGRNLHRPSRAARLRHALLYHAGRIGIYLALAAAAGSAGAAIGSTAAGRVAAFVAALVLLDRALGFRHGRLPSAIVTGHRNLLGRVGAAAIGWAQAHRVAGPIAAGAVHGLVPCGLLYAALIASAATGSLAGGLALMTGFGLGTLPVLVAISVASKSVPMRFRGGLRALTPAALVLTAALLLVRAFTPMAHETGAHAPSAATLHGQSHR